MPPENGLVDVPQQFLRARFVAAVIVAGIAVLTAASFWSLDLQWVKFFSADSTRRMTKFLSELVVPRGMRFSRQARLSQS